MKEGLPSPRGQFCSKVIASNDDIALFPKHHRGGKSAVRHAVQNDAECKYVFTRGRREREVIGVHKVCVVVDAEAEHCFVNFCAVNGDSAARTLSACRSSTLSWERT